MPDHETDICKRLEQLRIELYGARGKSEMARQLGIRPSTYDRYERDRTPPADLLVKVAELGGVTLEWLLTGEGPKTQVRVADPEAERLTQRVKELLVRQPAVRPVIEEFLGFAQARMAVEAPKVDSSQRIAIPVLGRVSNVRQLHEGDDRESFRIHRHNCELALLKNDQSGESRPATLSFLDQGLRTVASRAAVNRITYRLAGDSEVDLLEADGLDQIPADTVGIVIDDVAMEPEFRIGDIVFFAPSVAAESGQPAIVKLAGRNEYFVRLLHRELADVLLIPSNSRLPVLRANASELESAYQILAVVSSEDTA